MAELHILRVFCSPDGGGGNPLGVFLDGAAIAERERQPIAAELGFSETVFIDDRETGELRIFTPGTELELAGHPLVGTAWLLAREGEPVAALRPPAGEVAVRFDRGHTWIAGRPEWAPPFELLELASAAEVEALEGAPEGATMLSAWAWIDEALGLVRARVFVDELGIPEDEATGAAAMRLVAELGREIEIRQGVGSVLHARPRGELAEVGGRVELDELRDYRLPRSSAI